MKAEDKIAFKYARSCYDHLAGELGVILAHQLHKEKYIELDGYHFSPTSKGDKLLTELAIDLNELKSQKRNFAKACTDLTEKRFHIAGALGSALLNAFIEKNWLIKRQNSRILNITPEGKDAFLKWFKIDL